MKIICSILGHKMIQEFQATSDDPAPQKGWKLHKSVTSIYTCMRCCYVFTNKVNFGTKLDE